jgi:CRISPR-associated endonuclease/helicase Cas3
VADLLTLDPLFVSWAKRKLADGGKPVYHRLRNHCLDVLAVLDRLWHLAFNEGDRQRMAEGLGLSVGDAGGLIAFLAASHDVAKLTPAFQSKDQRQYETLVSAGLPRSFQAERAGTPHGTQSSRILKCFLDRQEWPEDRAEQIASAVGGHHGVFIHFEDLKQYLPIDLGDKHWREAQEQLLEQILLALNLDQLPCATSTPTELIVVLAGLVSVADWIASDDNLFPYKNSRESPQEYFKARQPLAEQCLKELGWVPSPKTRAFEGFTALFKFERSSSLQETLLRIAESQSGPCLMIVEAPMGDGKTEAAFAAAAVLRYRLGLRGFYCALPTQATSDQMFRRLITMLENQHGGDPQVVALLHGQASLSEEYAQLRRLGREYLKLADVGGPDAPSVLAGDWFARSKRGLLAPFGVGTVDQCLCAVLGGRHFFVRLFGLWGKVLVIDEVHAFDTYMTRILERLLEWVARMGTPVLLLSATLPASRREALAAAYQKGLESPVVAPEVCLYPRITVVQRGATVAIPTVARVSAKSIALCRVDHREFPDRLKDVFREDGNIVVVCNTVEGARRTYLLLKSVFPGEVDLLHSRFLVRDRQQRLDRTLERVSKGSVRPRRSIPGVDPDH